MTVRLLALAALLVLSVGHAAAEDPKTMFEKLVYKELGDELMECASVFGVVATCFKRDHQANHVEIGRQYETVALDTYTRSKLVYGLAGLSQQGIAAKVEFFRAKLFKEMNSDCINVQVVLNKTDSCVARLNSPKAHTEQVIEKLSR